jgi:hypothetical protein
MKSESEPAAVMSTFGDDRGPPGLGGQADADLLRRLRRAGRRARAGSAKRKPQRRASRQQLAEAIVAVHWYVSSQRP